MQRRASPVEERPPIQRSDLESLKRILLESLNQKQLLILSEISISTATINALVIALSCEQQIPLSTLKSNAKTLRQMGLIDCELGQPAKLTSLGELLLGMIDDEVS